MSYFFNGGVTEHGQSHFTPKWVKTIGAGLKIQWQRPSRVRNV
jgi:hypothetical protein